MKVGWLASKAGRPARNLAVFNPVRGITEDYIEKMIYKTLIHKMMSLNVGTYLSYCRHGPLIPPPLSAGTAHLDSWTLQSPPSL